MTTTERKWTTGHDKGHQMGHDADHQGGMDHSGHDMSGSSHQMDMMDMDGSFRSRMSHGGHEMDHSGHDMSGSEPSDRA